MDALLERLEIKLREWKPATANEVRQYVAEIMDLADNEIHHRIPPHGRRDQCFCPWTSGMLVGRRYGSGSPRKYSRRHTGISFGRVGDEPGTRNT